MTTPVRLDVGGTEFKTAKSTLGRHPQTLLGQFVTNESTAEYQLIQQGQPVFIDADPSLFPYVLRFYRHGTPILVDKSVDARQLQQELGFFGISLAMLHLQLPPEPEKPPEPVKKPHKLDVYQRLAKVFAQMLLRRDFDEIFPDHPPYEETCYSTVLGEAIAEVDDAKEYRQQLDDDVRYPERQLLLVMVEEELRKMIPTRHVELKAWWQDMPGEVELRVKVERP
mmetsp:Transcript_36932/g.92620  ORF Transcript_36932/g.92620 Transcript_36932/m.92620 type:complete len:225 (-) Transcript_36932:324-998(-)